MTELDNKDLFTKINVGSGTDLMTMTRWVLAQQQVRRLAYIDHLSIFLRNSQVDMVIGFSWGFWWPYYSLDSHSVWLQVCCVQGQASRFDQPVSMWSHVILACSFDPMLMFIFLSVLVWLVKLTFRVKMSKSWMSLPTTSSATHWLLLARFHCLFLKKTNTLWLLRTLHNAANTLLPLTLLMDLPTLIAVCPSEPSLVSLEL